MFKSAHSFVDNKLKTIEKWPTGQRLLFLGTLLVFAAIPLTVISAVSYRTLNTSAVTVNGPYGDCTAFGCQGPGLSASWPNPNFRVRITCCFVPEFGQYQNVGTARSYTAPYNIFKYEVQFQGLANDGRTQQWYNYASGDNGGVDKTISWGAPTYSAQLSHDLEFINGCYTSLGQTTNRLPNCVDSIIGTATSVTYKGLSPAEYYDLYVFIKDKGGINRNYTIQNHIGPTGACTNCPVLPPPPPPPPAKPAITGIDFVPACLYPGQGYGGTQQFRWSGSGATRYAVDISEFSTFSPGFTNKVVSGSTFSVLGSVGWQNQLYSTLATTSGNLSLQINKTYYVRIYAENASGFLYSDVKTIFVPACGQLPAKPTNLSNGLSTFLVCTNAGATWGSQAAFNWSGSGATQYAVDLADNNAFYPGFTNKILNVPDARSGTFNLSGNTTGGSWNNVLGTTYSLNGNLNLQPGKTYYWRVWAHNATGNVYSNISTIYMPLCSGQPPSPPTITGDSDLLTCAKTQTWGITHAFSWSGGWPAANFWIDVSDNSGFSNFVNKQLAGNVFATNGSGGWNANTGTYVSGGNLNLTVGRIYYFRIFAVNQYGGVHSGSKPFTLGACPPEFPISPQNTYLPLPWKTVDINSSYGGALFDRGTGNYSVNGSGADIWSTSDGFRYAWMELNGNGTIAVDVAAFRTISGTADGWAKAGLMIRESTAANSKQALLAATLSNGIAFQSRSETGGTSSHQWNGSVDGSRRPIRLVLTRSGTLITGYAIGADGYTYNKIGAVNINLPTRVLIGFAVSAHNANSIAQATFSRLSYGAYAGSLPVQSAYNLRIQEVSCNPSTNKATIKFKWDGPTEIGANYIVDLTTNQSTSRWTGSAGSAWLNNTSDRYMPKNANEYTWGNIEANTVHFWRVYNIHTRYHSHGTTFVPCQTKPSGSPVSGYISSYFGPSHPPGGIDIARGGIYAVEQLVYATTRGIVTTAGVDAGYGNTVAIWLPDTIVNGEHKAVLVRYGHFDSINPNIKVGSVVPWGAYLGIWGQSGSVDYAGGTDAIHVHYEVRVGPVNTKASDFTGGSYNVDPLGGYNIQTFGCSLGSCTVSPFM